MRARGDTAARRLRLEAGVGWALARFGTVHGLPSYLGAGNRAVQRAVSLSKAAGAEGGLGNGWCLGTAGLLVARCSVADETDLARLRADLLALDRQPLQRDLSLYHGELGRTEAMSVVSATAGTGAASPSLRRRAGLLLDALRRYSDYCGTPGGVPTPGLLGGLSGIGYGLLRLGFPDRVPPVLLLSARLGTTHYGREPTTGISAHSRGE